MSQETEICIKVAVLAIDSNGSPELLGYEINTTQCSIDEGNHFDMAKQSAREDGYEEPMMAFDQKDPAVKSLGVITEWFAAN